MGRAADDASQESADGAVADGHQPDGGDQPTGKVARLIAKYGLQEAGEALERRWTATGEDHASLRELADVFNRQLLDRRLAAAGVDTLAGVASNTYRLLTGEDVGAATRTRARRRLEREGVDVDALEAEFVSYQAVRTYLREHRGVEYDPDQEPVATATETIGRLRSRLASVTESKLESARRADEVTLEGYDVSVAVCVTCRTCGRQVPVERLLDRGGCDCSAEASGTARDGHP